MTPIEGLLAGFSYFMFLAWLYSSTCAKKLKRERDFFRDKWLLLQKAHVKSKSLIEGDEWKRKCGYD